MHTIAIDAMGGDNAPNQIIQGALDALAAIPDTTIILVGQQDVIEAQLKDKTYDKNRFRIHHASEVIATDEAAMAIRTKKDSSLAVGIDLLKAGTAQSFISAGSTGAVLAGATLKLKRLPGISRPALATLLPNAKGHSMLIDSGANLDSKPDYLRQFGILGTAYMQHVRGIANPTVGLVNVGTETDKGDAFSKEAYGILRDSNLHFHGNVEARDVAQGTCDVFVCDGFVGNVVLKTAEGYSKFIFNTIKAEIMATLRTKLGGLLVKPAFANIKQAFDYDDIGGAPFLGLRSLVIKAHGSSSARSIVGCVRQSKVFHDQQIIAKLEAILEPKEA